MELIQNLLTERRIGFAVPEISGRRPDQLSNLMAVLEFGAVYLQDSSGATKQRLRDSFHDPRLTAAGGPKE